MKKEVYYRYMYANIIHLLPVSGQSNFRKIIILFIFWGVCTGSPALCGLFSSCSEQGLLSRARGLQ